MAEFRNGFPVLSVGFSKDNSQVFAGGVDNSVVLWDLRMDQIVFKLQGHEDSVTGLRLSPNGSNLLTNSMDNTLRIWDVRPFCPTDRCIKIFQGHQVCIPLFISFLLRHLDISDIYIYFFKQNSTILRKIYCDVHGHMMEIE